jgi:hypothetical protein
MGDITEKESGPEMTSTEKEIAFAHEVEAWRATYADDERALRVALNNMIPMLATSENHAAQYVAAASYCILRSKAGARLT